MEENLHKMADFVDKYRRLGDVHLVEFVNKQMWCGVIPEKIQQKCLSMDNDEWYEFLRSTREMKIGVVCAETLEDYILNAKNHELQFLNVLTDVEKIVCDEENDFILKKCIKTKKSIEINRISKLINTLAKKNGTKNIIDIGSGKGYLSSYLSLNYSFNVLGIDSQQICCENATSRDLKLQKNWRSIKKNDDLDVEKGLFVSTTHFVEENSDILNLWDKKMFPCVDECFLITGLHTCGDLTPKMMKLFTNNDRFRCLVNVSCCYHLVEEEFCSNPFRKPGDLEPDFYGFPMSRGLRERKFWLGRRMRMLASESLDRMMDGNRVMNPSLFYRSIFQVILLAHFGISSDVKVGRIDQKNQSFVNYIRSSIKKLNLDDSKLTDGAVDAYLENYQKYSKNFECLYRLRGILAPVIESLIILDRFCYLQEQDAISDVVLSRIFNPVESPRCYCLIATKK